MPLTFSQRMELRRCRWIQRAFASIAPEYADYLAKSKAESAKQPTRTTVLNYLLGIAKRRSGSTQTAYLEIGVRRPAENFDHIEADTKVGVDPGVEAPSEIVDFRLTSDEFFEQLDRGAIAPQATRFDVVFLDGLHLAEQVDRDIRNALGVVKDHGFVVLHDCNPPTELHAREAFKFHVMNAFNCWTGTTWKAFLKWRSEPSIHSCCIDSDWGIGVLSRTMPLRQAQPHTNPFYEFDRMAVDRRSQLNLMSYPEFQGTIESLLDSPASDARPRDTHVNSRAAP